MKKHFLKKGIFTPLVMTIVMLLLMPTYSANAKLGNQEVERKVYTHEQISDEEIIDMAKNGELINEENITTNYQDGDISITEVKKVLSEDYVDGELVKQEVMSLQEIDINQSVIETLDENSLNELIINSVTDTSIMPFSNTGDKGIQSVEDSLTVRINVRMYYDIYFANNNDHYKIMYVTYIPTLLDSRFSLSGISSNIAYSGSGYKYSNGTYTKTTLASESTDYSNTSLTSGLTYTKNTNFSFYVNATDFSGGGVNTTLSYKRNSDGKAFSIKTPVLKF